MNTQKNIFHTNYFWILLVSFSILSIFFSFRYFSQAFPLVDIAITMNRVSATEKAHELAQQNQWLPHSPSHAAAFILDTTVRDYIELETGGNKSFVQFLQEHLYEPYTWIVRLFKENDPAETAVSFTSTGEPYGFNQTIPETVTGPRLSAEQARAIAEKNAHTEWHINFEDYVLIENSQKEHLSKRIDHSFVYERKNKKIGEALYRLTLRISGDKLTKLQHSMFIPESFLRHYQELRSANNTIFWIAYLIFMLLFVACGGIGGSIYLWRYHYLIIGPGLWWGSCIAVLQAALLINNFPFMWFSYDTASSTSVFILQQIVVFLTALIKSFAIYPIAILAAEGLDRKAFGNHIQLWKAWSTPLVNSVTILGQTIGAYLYVPLAVAYIVGFYALGSQFFGWWNPSSLFDPNILATYMPWFSPLAKSLGAGFWEECLFRAIPLSCAALFGNYFGRRKLFITIAFIFQVLVFGAAHATYPAFPSYVRLIELILPSCMFGFIYLLFGLLPVIISHTVFDILMFSLPLFVSTAPGALVNKIIVITISLIPILLIIAAYIKNKAFNKKTTLYNKNWKPEIPTHERSYTQPLRHKIILNSAAKNSIGICGLVGLSLWLLFSPFKQDAPNLAPSRNLAITQARTALEAQNIDLTGWRALTLVQTNQTPADRYIWQTKGKAIYHNLIGNYLEVPHWLVRFVRFEGNVAERAEEFHVYLSDVVDRVYRITHIVPQQRPGAKLSENAARQLARKTLATEGLPDTIREISAKSVKQPARLDWRFEFESIDPQFIKQDIQARTEVTITGDTVTDIQQSIHIPEEWGRNDRNTTMIITIIYTLTLLAGILLLVCCLWLALRYVLFHSLGLKKFLTITGGLFLLIAISTFNRWALIIAQFKTTEPFSFQIISALISLIFYYVPAISCFALLIYYYSKTAHSGISLHNKLQKIFFAGSLGLLYGGITTFIMYILPHREPYWATNNIIGGYFPWLYLKPLTYYIPTVMLAYCLVRFLNYMNSHHKNYLLIVIAIIAAMTVNPLSHVLGFSGWLMLISAAALFFIVTYKIIFAYDQTWLPVSIALVFIVNLLHDSILTASGEAVVGHVLAIIGIAISALLFMFTLPESR